MNKLRNDNALLRKELKILNSNLTELIEQIKDYNIKKKPVKEINIEQHMKAQSEELNNFDKWTKNLYYEYEHLQKRLDMISDPLYPNELKRKVNDIDNRIKFLMKEHKVLVLD